MSTAHRAVARLGEGPCLHVETAGQGAPLVLLHGFALHGGLFAPLLPAAELLRLPGAAHAPLLSHPEVFRDALLAFLTDG